jgi:predicted phage terminase large subunit-like protein
VTPTELIAECERQRTYFKDFTQTFFKIRTGRDFVISEPISRESHYLTMFRALTRVLDGKCNRLMINVPPRYGKSETLIHFIPWALANHPDSNFLYISYSHSLARKQTQQIRDIINLPTYKVLFGISIKEDVSAKDNFEVTAGGSVYAAGSGGTITGRGAGIANAADRFSGAIIIDDIHKPDEVTSDVMREAVIDWYYNTLQSRLNNPNVPIIFIGQRLHEADLAAQLIEKGDWEVVSIPALDAAGNALDPSKHDRLALLKMQEVMPYVFASQYQQDPQPAGGGIFKPDWIKTFEYEPEFLATFITGDTAETDKTYNDATAFGFWGVYKIVNNHIDTGMYGLHLIDCLETRVEPKDLLPEFTDFYSNAMRHKVKPSLVAIEKKSTGVTLLSILQSFQGLRIMNIERTKASGSKTARFLEMQQYLAQGQVSVPQYARFTKQYVEHIRKITANNTHRNDDLCDMTYDAIKAALIDKIIIGTTINTSETDDIVIRLNRKMIAKPRKYART